MGRLIDANKMQELAFQFNFDRRITERELFLFNRAIEEMPTVDAVPVVRCKDCKWNYDTSVNHGNMFPKCKFTDYVRTGDFYCAMGERREDNG